ncbi:MAG: RNA polymerase sigma factor [Fuerstiella sp.]
MISGSVMNKTYNEDDQRMIRLQEGDAAAFDEIVAAWQSPLFGFFFRNTRDVQRSEDLVQETMLRLYRKAWDYIPTGRFRGWLFRVARNLLIDNVRRLSTDALVRKVTVAKSSDGESVDILDLLPDDVVSADVRVDQLEVAEVVHELLQELPDEQRQTFTLHHFDSLTLSEVADAMETTLPTAKSRLRLAREKLRYQLTCRGFAEETVSENN